MTHPFASCRFESESLPNHVGQPLPGRLASLLLLILSLQLPIKADAASPGDISPGALAEISSILQAKARRTPTQQKMESQLVHLSKISLGETYAPGSPNHRLDILREADGRVKVDINANVTPALLSFIEQIGGTVLTSVPEYHSVRVLATTNNLETLAAFAEVQTIKRAARCRTLTGSIDSEGDTTHQAIQARSLFGTTGAGVNVGVLSDSTDGLSASATSGDLGPVTVLSGQSGIPGTGEGTAMLEIIHDLAPGASLFFATAYTSEASYAQNIIALFNAGCRILVDDVSYFDESPFQDGPVAKAINTVTAGGALYFSAAGNSGNLDSGYSGTWEGDFVSGGTVTTPGSGQIHRFGTTTYNAQIAGANPSSVDLFWSDPLGQSSNDYDLFILDSTGATVIDSSTSLQNGSQDPYESVSAISTDQRIVVVLHTGQPRFLHLDTGGGLLSIATQGASTGHSGAANAISVAAVDVANTYTNAFTGGSFCPVELFSSDGPRRIFYNPAGTALTPGNFSSTGGVLLQKPDLAAADGVSVFVAGFSPFFGTSAAAPHAAAIAALLKSYHSSLTPAQIRATLTSSAIEAMATGPDRNAGYGIVMPIPALLAAPNDPLFLLPSTGLRASGTSGGSFVLSSPSFTLTNAGPSAFSWTLMNTSAWFSLTPASGSVSPGGAAATVNVTLTSTATNLPGGTNYTATVWFTNLTTHLGQSRLLTLAVRTPTIASYPDAVIALNPFAYWRLNETNYLPPSGMASNYGTMRALENGSSYDAVNQGQPGRVGTSFGFSNSNQDISLLGSHVDAPYSAKLNPNGPFTVELWARPTIKVADFFCPAASLDLNQNGGISRAGWIFYQSSNTWQFRVGGLSGYTATTDGGSVQLGVWQHLVGVYDGTSASLYVNGTRVSGPLSASGFAPNLVAPFRVGASTIPNRTFNGLVDEVAFYTNALSATRIAAHFAAASTNNSGYGTLILQDNPAIYWRLDEPAYSTLSQAQLPVATNIGSLSPMGHGRYQQGCVLGVSGYPNGGFEPSNVSAQFSDRSGGYLDVGGAYLNLTGPFTLLTWTKPNPANGNLHSLVDKGIDSYHLYLDATGHPRFGVGSQPVADLTGPNRIDDGQWHFLAAVYNGTTTESLYVDGQLASSNSGATSHVTGNSSDLWIGGDPDLGANQVFDGLLDEIAIFTNALTTLQIQQLYAAGTNGPAPVPTISSAIPNRQAGTILLTWASQNQKSYNLQFKTNLAQSTWTILTNLTAIGSTTSFAAPVSPSGNKFYRIELIR